MTKVRAYYKFVLHETDIQYNEKTLIDNSREQLAIWQLFPFRYVNGEIKQNIPLILAFNI
ncbi:hypothetical protein QPK24_12285 [Paenibacillus polygoni]|uniref:Uncharacterized protein n=1 Tax=Paenibacillus polygoni TaxID=3050112 RepID=A0ABY8WX92_9BACL|nr:hypothetical protein [Paenibacillus polygoni]WIV17233.1 hypothetical protein QPK24_12285 [Paenibacillus polygoni]